MLLKFLPCSGTFTLMRDPLRHLIFHLSEMGLCYGAEGAKDDHHTHSRDTRKTDFNCSLKRSVIMTPRFLLNHPSQRPGKGSLKAPGKAEGWGGRRLLGPTLLLKWPLLVSHLLISPFKGLGFHSSRFDFSIKLCALKKNTHIH